MKTLSALVAVLALALAGCGETLLDTGETEAQLKTELTRTGGLQVSSVDCPSDVQVKAGETFDCTVKIKSGGEMPAKMEVINSDADLRLLNTSSFEGSNK
jgi:hypothetical protein